MPAASFWLYNWVRCSMIAAAAVLKSCVLFCCAAAGSADTMAAIESRNCFIEATLIAGDKSIIKEETNYSAYVVNRKALSVEFQRLAETAAERAGFPGFKPECCLINRYEPGAKLSLHQDRD